ncbi:MAG: hypothetical protein JXK05_05100 [Campylobacterales bacterium]|nr:hypothetical protein [Campylobacterales bacterium]
MRLPTKTKPAALPVAVVGKQKQISISAEKVNLVLTPAFYWFKKEQLPVQSVAKAKQLAPSLFDGSVPEGSYSYAAIKQEDGFWLFAYDDALIASHLAQLGIKSAQIAGIYFAQTECSDLEEPLLLEDGSVLLQRGGVVSVVDQRYCDATLTCKAYFDTRALSKHTVNVSFFRSNLLDEKHLYRLMALCIAFIVAFFAHYLMLRSAFGELLGKEQAVIEHYQLPQTSFELDGLKNALQGKEAQQMQMRERFKAFLSLPLEKGEYLQKVQITQKSATLEIVLGRPDRAEVLKNAFQKSVNVTSAKVVDKTFYVAVAL